MSDGNSKNSPAVSKTQIDQSNVSTSTSAGISTQPNGKKRSMDQVKSSIKSSNSASSSNDNASNTEEVSGDDLNDVTPQGQNEDDQSESEVEAEDGANADVNVESGRSWVWSPNHAVIVTEKNDRGEIVKKTSRCTLCPWKVSFNGTKQVANHLRKKHNLDAPKKATPENTRPNVNIDAANEFLLRFIITGFLPFIIVQNEDFKK